VLIGEAKTSDQINAEDVRKLGKLADAIPPNMAEAFVMFAKTTTFTTDEITLAKSLNSSNRQRLILWSREQLEPYVAYERSEDRLGRRLHASSLIDTVEATAKLWP
jgi:pyridoxal/pyridoxine/pyridoxamine kinase